jgi:exodeoxyribonuclease-5
MICRRNSWDNLLVDGRLPTPLVNGLIGYVTNVEEKQIISNLPWKPDGFMFSSNQLNLRPIFEDTAELTELKYIGY